MQQTVPEDVLQNTTKCEWGHSCLESGQLETRPMCTVNRVFGENLMFIESPVLNLCPYRLSFGFGYICTCPTHFALQKTSK